MFRRLLAAVALVGTTFAITPNIVRAESGGGVAGTTATKMGQIAAGNGFTCLIVDGGKVACWGRGNAGVIGDGNLIDRSIMTLADSITNAIQISAGSSHVCAVLADSTAMCWGSNTYGQLGNGNQTTQASPVAVCSVGSCSSSLTGVSSISAGAEHTCAVMTDHTVTCWGNNSGSRLGGTAGSVSTTPIAVTGVTDADKIDAGTSHTCIVRTTKAMRCWGTESRGALGNSSVSSSAEAVTVVSAGKAIMASNDTSCAINDSDSTIKCWGSNTNGQHGVEGGGPGNLTYDMLTHDSTPSTVTYGSSVTALAIAGTDSAGCAVTTANGVICWGAFEVDASRAGASPGFGIFAIEPISGVSNAVAVTVGNDHGCMLLSTDVVKCWGNGSSGQMGQSNTNSSTSSLATPLVPVWRSLTFPSIANTTMASADIPIAATVSSGPTSVDYPVSASSSGVCNIESPNGLDYSLRLQGAGTCTVSARAIWGSVGGTLYGTTQSTSRTFTISNSAPVVTSVTSSSATSSSADVSATINAANLSTTVSFRYSTNSQLSGATTVASSAVTGRSAATRTVSLTGLAPGRTYFFAVDATNSVGTTTSAVTSFATTGTVPVVTSGAPTSVSSGRATLNGTVSPGDLTTAVWFTIGQKSDLSDGSKIEYRDLSGSTTTDVSVTATNLTESVRYYFRIEASNSLGSARGDIKSFTAARPTGLSINDAAEFTNKKSVTLYATGPSGATQVIVSNDGGFKSSETFTLTDNYAEIPWTLVASRDERLPKTVYARFVQRFGSQSANYSDDIILDTTAPEMSSASGSSTGTSSDNVTVQGVRISAAKGAVKLTVKAKDSNSGIGKVQVKGSSGGSPVDVETGSPKATSRTVKVNTTKKKLWVRVVDRAGNVSKWVTVTVK